MSPPNCGPKFERVLMCMEEKHSANSCKDVVQDFLRCQREFVRSVAKEKQRRISTQNIEAPNDSPVVGKAAQPAQRQPRSDLTYLTESVAVQSLTKAAKQQVNSMKQLWGMMLDPKTHRNYYKFCGRLSRKVAATVDKAVNTTFGRVFGGRDRT